MTTAEKSYDAWQAPHFRTEKAAREVPEANSAAPTTTSAADTTAPEPEAPKAGLLAQVAGLKAEEDKLKAEGRGTVDQLTEEEKLALRIAPQGFNASAPAKAEAPAQSGQSGSDQKTAEADEDEDDDAESEMIREASPFVRELIGALKTVYDPEIPVDIFELGLIYKIDVDDDKNIKIDMTLTAPGCPVAGEMPIMVENAIKSVKGVKDVDINMVFDPPWTPEKMSEEARLSLNMF